MNEPQLLDGADAYRKAFRAGIKPDERLKAWEWADRFRRMDQKAAAEPGRWRTSRTPYLREILDCLSIESSITDVTFIKGSQVGGPLCLNTPIPTPTGWTTMGEISVGDSVFDEHGNPCLVTGVSPIFENRDCYEVHFSDDAMIRCDGEHRWRVWNERNRKKVSVCTMTTEEMLPDHRRGGHFEFCRRRR